jgi:hypothetical protein
VQNAVAAYAHAISNRAMSADNRIGADLRTSTHYRVRADRNCIADLGIIGDYCCWVDSWRRALAR